MIWVKQQKGCRICCDIAEVTKSLENEQSSFSKLHCFTYVTAHCPTLLLLYLYHSSYSNPSIASSTSQLILQPFCYFTYSMSQLILQPFCYFTYITAHSPTLLLLYLHHSSFSNPSVVSPASQLILQPFYHFTYITAHSPNLLLLYLHHSSFSNPSFASPTSPGEPPMGHVTARNMCQQQDRGAEDAQDKNLSQWTRERVGNNESGYSTQ